MDVDPPTIITRWALQRGVVAFPTLQKIIQEGSALTSAAKYEAWAAKLKAMLRARTLHLHSPTESRRVHLSTERLAILRELDREEKDRQKRYDDMLKDRSRAKLKPMRAAANAVMMTNMMKAGISKTFDFSAEEEKELGDLA